MGKCNLLAPISQNTGNFVLFSQYSEDLTKTYGSEDFYRVVPSRYVLLDLNPKEGWDAVKYAEYFQNYYENACSLMRGNSEIGWTPDCATSMLWKSLVKTGLIDYPQPVDEHPGLYTSSSVVLTGDIDITSDKQFDGINYTETYIGVPQGANRKKYEFSKYSSESTRVVTWGHDYIDGYPDDMYPKGGAEWPTNKLSVSEDYSDGYIESSGEYVYELRTPDDFCMITDPVEELEDDKYQFNCVLVLYDIHKRGVEDGMESVLYENVPMGIYFTGTPGQNGEIQNPVTIWTSNPEIYQQGTSYGFRICTRYLSTQNSLYIIDSTIEDTTEMYDQYCAVMSKIGDSQKKMEAIYSKMSEYQNSMNEHLANIKNYRVNVPYIREIGGKSYWFVNGRNLGTVSSTVASGLVWENY